MESYILELKKIQKNDRKDNETMDGSMTKAEVRYYYYRIEKNIIPLLSQNTKYDSDMPKQFVELFHYETVIALTKLQTMSNRNNCTIIALHKIIEFKIEQNKIMTGFNDVAWWCTFIHVNVL